MMKPTSKFTLLLLCVFFASSCAMLDRRDHLAIMDDQFSDPMFTPYEDFDVVPGDEGRFLQSESMRGRVPATAEQAEYQRYNQSIFNELQALENRLSDVEYEEYAHIKDLLGSDHERIYFLRLLPEEKKQYLRARNIFSTKRYAPARSIAGGFGGELALGMERDDVLGSWGQPDKRDYAGIPEAGNERWGYYRGGRTKFIYFESGRVEGWSEQ